ncbi:MAG: bacillithiol biosynthesis cysteine-adding enzyme BshC [Acidobacteriota bacterium]
MELGIGQRESLCSEANKLSVTFADCIASAKLRLCPFGYASMTGVCVRQNELPGSSRIFVDFLYDFERVKNFFSFDPVDADALTKAVSQIEYPAERRVAVASALREVNGDHPSVEIFARPGTVAVLTGQQVGLYGGPAYTLYKALSAISVARQITAAGQPAIPIFWLATEDHDVEEIRSAAFWDQTITAEAASDGRPAGVHALAGLPNELALSPEVAALAQRHYRNGVSFGDSFLGLLKELLAPLGMLFADPLAPALRGIGAEFLATAARRAPELSRSLVRRNSELAAAGYHAQVHFAADETSLFFLLESGRRRQLKFNSQTYDGEAMAAHGAALSPNALLRPVWQDWLFPTAAVVAGPGEIAYFAQSSVLYRELLGRMPVMLPRAFFTLVDEKSAKIIERYRVRFADILQDEEHVRQTLADRLIPPDLKRTLRDTENRLESTLEELENQLEAFDPTLAAALDLSRRKIRYQFAKNYSKVVSEVLRKSEQAQRQAAHLSHRLAPRGHLQERHYSLLALLSDFGLELIPTLLDNIHHGCHDHHVLLLG